MHRCCCLGRLHLGLGQPGESNGRQCRQCNAAASSCLCKGNQLNGLLCSAPSRLHVWLHALHATVLGWRRRQVSATIRFRVWEAVLCRDRKGLLDGNQTSHNACWADLLAKTLRRFNSTNNTAHTSNLWPHMPPLVVGSTRLAPCSPLRLQQKLDTWGQKTRTTTTPWAVLQLPLSLKSTGS